MRHAGHFVRLLALVAIAVVGFLYVRSLVVPKDFGVKGHYRLSAIEDEAKREARHIGSEACAECHDDIGAAWKAGKHHTPQCENCHGPGLMHTKVVAEEPTTGYPDPILKFDNAIKRPTGIMECKWCHLKTFERPSTLKSISSVKEHVESHHGTYAAETKCIDCHNPHTTVVTLPNLAASSKAPVAK
jgi:hypothetical protein